jgi:hypothetical protein
MAIRKKGSSRKKSSSTTTPILTYTVTVAHEPGSECDACSMPRSVLIEQEPGAWVCEMCLDGMNTSDFFRAALVNGLYSWGDE